MSDDQKKRKFVDELTKLSNEHGFYISGCGCCSSPWLDESENKIGFYVSDDQGDSELQWHFDGDHKS